MQPLTFEQFDAVRHHISGIVVFGQYLGGVAASKVWPAREKAGVKTPEETSHWFRASVLLTSPEGLPESRIVELHPKERGGAAPVPNVLPGGLCLVQIESMRFDEYTKEKQVRASAIVAVPAPQETGKPEGAGRGKAS